MQGSHKRAASETGRQYTGWHRRRDYTSCSGRAASVHGRTDGRTAGTAEAQGLGPPLQHSPAISGRSPDAERGKASPRGLRHSIVAVAANTVPPGAGPPLKRALGHNKGPQPALTRPGSHCTPRNSPTWPSPCTPKHRAARSGLTKQPTVALCAVNTH